MTTKSLIILFHHHCKTSNLSKKSILFLGVISYSVLLCLSVIYFKERAIFADVSYILFKLILQGEYAIQVNRFVSVFTQSFGLFSSKLGLPLYWVTLIHSAGFIIYYFTIFMILLTWFKNKSLALGLMLFNILMVAYSFYWTPNELIQGMAFVFLYLAALQNILKSKKLPIVSHILSVAFLSTSIFAHPLLVSAILFGILYLGVHHLKRYRLIVGQLILTVVITMLKFKVFVTPHDVSSMAGVSSIKRFIENFRLENFYDFFNMLVGDYLIFSVCSLILFIYFLSSRQILKLLLFTGCFVGYSIVVNIGQKGASHQFYIESQYLVLSFFTILPLVTEVLPKVNNKLQVAILAFVILASLTRIQQTHTIFTKRLEWQRNFLAETKFMANNKFILQRKDVPMDLLLESWGSAFEFWLLSTLESGETRSIYIVKNEETANRLINQQKANTFIASWNQIPYNWFNPNYFILKDTSQYQHYNPRE